MPSSNNNPCFEYEGPRKRPPQPLKHNGETYYIQHDGHGEKHILPKKKSLSDKEKQQMINNTRQKESKFFPNIINASNYDEIVPRVVRYWIEGEANGRNMTVDLGEVVGADRGRSTRNVLIYLSESPLGAHIRPFSPEI